MGVASNKELKLHNAIKHKDNLALAKLYDLYGDSLVTTLKSRYPRASSRDELFIFESVNEALFGYYKNPETYNPELNTLKRFLEMAAERDLLNILQKEKRHSNKKDLPDDVELQDIFWNNIKKDENLPDGNMVTSETFDLIENELKQHFSNDQDISLAKMILSGERATEAFAELLAINHLSLEEQRLFVKKTKDRIKKVIERNEVESKLKNILR